MRTFTSTSCSEYVVTMSGLCIKLYNGLNRAADHSWMLRVAVRFTLSMPGIHNIIMMVDPMIFKLPCLNMLEQRYIPYICLLHHIQLDMRNIDCPKTNLIYIYQIWQELFRFRNLVNLVFYDLLGVITTFTRHSQDVCTF